MIFACQPTPRVPRTRIVLHAVSALGFLLAAGATAGCSEPAPASTSGAPDTAPSTMPNSTGVIDQTSSMDAGPTRADAGSVPELDAGVTWSDAAPSVPVVPSVPPTREDAAAEAMPDSAAAPPTRADSCFGRCGFSALLALPADCACDVGCLMRGDCCADKHELCAVSDAAPVCSLTGPDIDRPLCGTDLGWSFTHEGALEIFFGDSYTAQCTVPLPSDDSQGRLPVVRPAVIPDTPPSAPVACGSLIDLDTTGTGPLETFAPMRLFEDGNELSGSLLETPLTGFSDGTHVYTLSRRGSDFGPLYVARRDPSVAPNVKPGRNLYRVIERFATTHFQNPTATAIASFDPSKPFERSDQTGTTGLFLWGRNDFAGDSARALYLAYQPLPIERDDGSSLWAPQFFAGLVSGVPTWVSDEKKAVPVIDGDFAQVGQHEVSFVPALNKWIMLYGGDVSETLDPTQNDQPRHGAIHLRMADAPWGPFTRAAPAFWREHAAHFMHCDAPKDPPPGVPAGCDLDQLPDDPAHSYSPGTWAPQLLDFTGCRTDSPVPQSPADDPETGLLCTGTQRGTLYGPNLLEPWTVDRAGDQGYAHAATLYFNVSTWVPYQVILAALTVHLP